MPNGERVSLKEAKGFTVSAHDSVGSAMQFSIMEHVRRLVLVPEHMAEQRKKPLVPPWTAQVSEIDSDMHTLLERQDIAVDKQAKLYDQSLHSKKSFSHFKKKKLVSRIIFLKQEFFY